MKSRNELPAEKELFSGLLLLNAKILGLVLGLLWGIGLFVATNWLIIKGGNNIGHTLQKLSHYYIGYKVTFMGSLIGFVYGFATGNICGIFIGWLYNKIALFRQKL